MIEQARTSTSIRPLKESEHEEADRGTNMGRHKAYRALLARGYRTEIQGVTMHRPNEPGYNRPGVYIIDDWR